MTKAAKIRRALTKGIDTADIAKKYGVTPDYVYSIKYKQKKSESRNEVLKRTMPKQFTKAQIAALGKNKFLHMTDKQARTALDKLGIDKKPSKIVAVANKTKAELTAIDAKAAGDKLLGKDVGGLTLTKLDKDTYRWVRTDLVNHPPHYKAGGVETIDFIEAKDLNYRLGNVVKYVSRAGRKGDPLEDLKKAAWYLNREIAVRERA